ncbi:hypothetical protein Ocin01_07465 [Orchesella cincta]|uniref:RING finger protein n=1 Tax=Orchesella cincta TaxID=48709 RepID=A0A1D2N1Q0_ORCCI|nr:hypothetical protein Ocin01_07465 [Orchesella cincta]
MSDEQPPEAPGPSCKFSFRKPIRRGQQNARKREERPPTDSSSSSSDDDTKIVRTEKRARRSNPMVQSTSGPRTVKNQLKTRGSSSSSEDEDDGKKRDGRSRVGVYYESSNTGDRAGPSDMGATSIIETETEKDRDAQAIFEKSLEINKELKGKADDGVYRGLNNYARYYDKKDTAQGNAASGSNRKGPVRAPDNIRVTVRWDYQPDICKDYKETGFCGFGDSCKFLHDRSDYKFGWQIEREMNEGRYGKDDDDAEKYEIPDSDDELPFKCLLCRDTFKDPVVTKCKHYFCEKCALQHYKKTQKCYICSAQTFGVFNPAKEIIAKLKNEEESGGGAGGGDQVDSD